VQDTKLFETILGIQMPWRISRVETGYERRARGSVGGARGYAMAVPRVPAGVAVSRSRRGAGVATPRHVSVPDVSPRPGAARGLPDARRAAGPRAVDRGPQSVHDADGAADHRSDSAVQHGDRRLPHRPDHLGRGVGCFEPCGRAWPRP
jgi:hypothetical protein